MKAVLFAIVTISSALSSGAMVGEPPTKIHCRFLNNEIFTVDIVADHFVETIAVNDAVSDEGDAFVTINGPGINERHQGIVKRKEYSHLLFTLTKYHIDLGGDIYLDLNYWVKMGEVIQESFTGELLLNGNIDNLTCNYKQTNIYLKENL